MCLAKGVSPDGNESAVKAGSVDVFHMSFFMFSTTIFALEEIGSLTPKEKCLATLAKPSVHADGLL
jgi:hypothetical protein